MIFSIHKDGPRTLLASEGSCLGDSWQQTRLVSHPVGSQSPSDHYASLPCCVLLVCASAVGRRNSHTKHCAFKTMCLFSHCRCWELVLYMKVGSSWIWVWKLCYRQWYDPDLPGMEASPCTGSARVSWKESGWEGRRQACQWRWRQPLRLLLLRESSWPTLPT